MHAHFFNATDLLVVEYLMGPVVNDFVGDRFRFTRRLISIIAQAIVDLKTKKSILAAYELRWLQAQDKGMHLTKSFITHTVEDEYKEVSVAFFEVISEKSQSIGTSRSQRQAEFSKLLDLVVSEWDAQDPVMIKNRSKSNMTIPFNEMTIFQAVTAHPASGLKTQKRRGLNIPSVCPSTPWIIERLLGFVGRALVRRSTNVQAYYNQFTLGAGLKQPAVRHVLNIGCDFDYFLACKTSDSSIDDQIAVNEEIYLHTNGYAIPVLGVNPFKIISDPDYLSLIDKTLARKIYKGVKLYPSIGYSVTGEVRGGLAECRGYTATNDNIPTAMNELFEIVESREAFVTSHTTQSKGATTASIQLASSRFWAEVLKKRPSLRVNLGHMGDPDNEHDTHWREGFLSLMASFENVYGDFGYHFEYTEYRNLKRDIDRFRLLHGAEIFKKITYGSDWYMISKDSGANAYLCDITRTFYHSVEQGDLTEDNLKDIFYRNAQSMLKL